MEFGELFKRIEYKIRMLSRKYKNMCSYFDEEDLYQEMCKHLWNSFKDGVPLHFNDSYIIKGCEFHILNYLRKEKEKIIKISLEKEINEEGDTLKDVLALPQEPLDSCVDRKMVIEHILNNGFSKKEKEAFSLLARGYTVREAGRIMKISHVMVVKLKSSLIRKYQANIKNEVTN